MSPFPHASILSALLVAATCLWWWRKGIAQGLHRQFHGMEIWQTHALAVAISDLCIGGRRNYTAEVAVAAILKEHGLGDPNSGAYGDPDRIDGAIRAACALDRRTALESRSFALPFDYGMVDHMRWAFRLFGFRLSAIYHMTFLIMALSGSVMVIGLYHRPEALMAGAGILLCLAVSSLAAPLFDNPETSFNGKRYLSALSIPPFVHILLALSGRHELTPLAALTIALQGLLAGYGIRVRNSALWFLPATLAVLAFLGIGSLFRLPLGAEGDVVSWLVSEASRGYWCAPVAIIPIVWITRLSWRRASPVHRSEECMMSYPKWHSAYVGLALDPETWARNRHPDQLDGLEDENGFKIARHLLETDTRFQDLDWQSRLNRAVMPIHFGFKWRHYESAIRAAFTDYAKRNADSFPRLYFYLKPKAYVRDMAWMLATMRTRLSTRAGAWFWLLLLPITAGMVACLGQLSPAAITITLLTGVTLTVAVSAPMIWAYSMRHGLADQVAVTLFGFWLTLTALAGLAIRLLAG